MTGCRLTDMTTTTFKIGFVFQRSTTFVHLPINLTIFKKTVNHMLRCERMP